MPAMYRMRRYRGIVGWLRRLVTPRVYHRDWLAAQQEREETQEQMHRRLMALLGGPVDEEPR